MAKGFEIISIFGQCERVAADMMAKKYTLRKIAPGDFVDGAPTVNEEGTAASFAIVMPQKYMGEFLALIMDLRA